MFLPRRRNPRRLLLTQVKYTFLKTLWQCNRRHFAAGKLLLDFKKSVSLKKTPTAKERNEIIGIPFRLLCSLEKKGSQNGYFDQKASL